MKGVSKVVAVVLAIVMLAVGVGIGLLITPYVAEPRVVAEGLSGEIPIGALLPLSGPLGKFGENDKVAVQLAEKDVNSFLERVGAKWRIKVYIENTETRPEVALEKLMSLHAKGVRAVVGPMASGEVLKIKEYADSNKILVISQSSTSPRVAIKDDYIYRFVPTDVYQGKISPAYAKILGVTHIILVYLANPWGDGLAAEVEANAKRHGIEIAAKLRIPEGATDYSAEAASLASEVNKLVEKGVPPEKIMVHLITYAEAVTFFHSARGYDVLWKVKWFGSDGTAFEYSLQESPQAAEFAAAVGFPSPIAAPIGDNYLRVMKHVKDEIGRTPEPYAYNSYDAIWVIALAVLFTGKYDADTIISVLPDVIKVYYGASGYIKLNEYGDRVGEQYWIVSLVRADGGYDWKPVAIYDCIADEVTLLRK